MPTSPVTTIFLDDGVVMNDNTLRGPQWQRLHEQTGIGQITSLRAYYASSIAAS